MRIPCPFCGERDVSEFTCRGEVSGDLYARANPAGRTQEHWRHDYGCRRWMVVERDTRTHQVFGARLP